MDEPDENLELRKDGEDISDLPKPHPQGDSASVLPLPQADSGGDDENENENEIEKIFNDETKVVHQERGILKEPDKLQPEESLAEGNSVNSVLEEMSTNPTGTARGAKLDEQPGRILIFIKDKLVEQSPKVILKPKAKLKRASRRDFLVYGGGMAALAAGFWWLLPDETKAGLGFASSEDALKRRLLNDTLSFDDLVGQGLFSQSRLVPTYSKSQMTEVPNNYAGQTPDEDVIGHWELQVKGLANNRDMAFSSEDLMKEFSYHEQITRLVCVEGWSAISGWGGLRFADLIRRYPPRSDCKWIQLRSDVNLDGDGNPDPYFVSFDLPSAMHPQTLLATHHNGKPLELEHGAPLRLLAPMKLGLKNIKAVTSIIYSPTEPDDYWNQNGYSYYDGI